MGASFTTLAEIAVELVNGSDPSLALGTISSTQEWLKSGEMNRLFVLSDATIARGICDIKGHGARKTFLTGSQTGIANGAQLNAMVGPVERIEFVISGGRWAGTHPGTVARGASLEDKLRWLRLETLNVTANPAVEPHYVQDGSTLSHNAAGLVLGGAASASVNATYAVFTINFAASSAQCPDEFAQAIAAGALKLYMAKDGHRVEAAQYFNGIYVAEMQVLGVPTPQEMRLAA